MINVKELTSYSYCKWVLEEENKKVGVYVKKQAQRFLDIVEDKDSDAYFDIRSHKKVDKLLSIIIHPDLCQPMNESLEFYQWLIIDAIFCIKNREDDTRYYQTVLLEIARKNFKSFTCAIVIILLMLLEPRFSRFFSVAPDLQLSKEVQVAIHKIIESSPALIDEKKPRFKNLRDEIRCLLTDSEFKPLACSNDRLDGKLAHAWVADEVAALKSSYPIEAMRSSQITLKNKLGMIISTQYSTDTGAFSDEVDISKKVLDGISSNKRRFALLYEPDDDLKKGEQWKDNDLVIYQANPVSINNELIFKSICELRETAVLYENKRENFLTKHCNIQYSSLGTEGYVELDKLRLCEFKEDDSWWEGKNVYLGLDLSMTGDNICVSMNAYEGQGMEDSIIYTKCWGFIPADKLEEKSKKERVDYKKYIDKGLCFACGDSVISYTFVEDFILSIEEKYGVHIMQLGYDKWNATSTVQHLEEKGIECVEVGQSYKILHPALKLLKEKIYSDKYRYFPNQMLEQNFANARISYDNNFNMLINKKKSTGKIDQVDGTVNAIVLILQELLWGEQNFVVQGIW